MSRDVINVNDLDLALWSASDALARVPGEAWSGTAGTLTWTRRATAEHLVDDLVYYAAALGIQARHRLALSSRLDDGASPEAIAEAVQAAGAVLAAVAVAAPEDAMVVHADGRRIDVEGHLALGVAETLLHTHDVVSGLDIRFHPAGDVARRVLARLFPQVVSRGEDPWLLLQWATGRAHLPDRPHVERWEYAGEPATTGILL